MPAPTGNTNAKDGKRWAGALRRALHEYSDETVSQGDALLAIAQGVVKDALAGDAFARKEIGDRLDGKAAQSVTISGDEDAPLQHTHTVEFIGASAAPSET